GVNCRSCYIRSATDWALGICEEARCCSANFRWNKRRSVTQPRFCSTTGTTSRAPVSKSCPTSNLPRLSKRAGRDTPRSAPKNIWDRYDAICSERYRPRYFDELISRRIEQTGPLAKLLACPGPRSSCAARGTCVAARGSGHGSRHKAVEPEYRRQRLYLDPARGSRNLLCFASASPGGQSAADERERHCPAHRRAGCGGSAVARSVRGRGRGLGAISRAQARELRAGRDQRPHRPRPHQRSLSIAVERIGAGMAVTQTSACNGCPCLRSALFGATRIATTHTLCDPRRFECRGIRASRRGTCRLLLACRRSTGFRTGITVAQGRSVRVVRAEVKA